jgi:hypothetical protein
MAMWGRSSFVTVPVSAYSIGSNGSKNNHCFPVIRLVFFPVLSGVISGWGKATVFDALVRNSGRNSRIAYN